MIINIKKDMELEEKLLSRKGKVDVNTTFKKDTDLFQVWQRYQHSLYLFNVEKLPIGMDRVLEETKEIISINQIMAFAHVAEETTDEHLNTVIASTYVSCLLQNAYNDGQNEFNFKNHKLVPWLRFVKGTEERPLKISIEGDVSKYFAVGCEYTHIVIRGDINIVGFAHNAMKSTFEIYGEFYGENMNTLENEVFGECNGCTFITDNKSTLDVLTGYISDENRIMFKDQVVRDYDN
tara:strand:- start:3471 stop:4178 length:708 start_codon:yes stop_codon:yes gene_type:complete